MNKICAAGTGSFIEEQSNKFNIPIETFGDLALSSSNPINLGERCTVFIETSIAANLSAGAELKDIASGLCYSIAKNYLNKVVGQKKIGNKISFQGGVAYNQGVVNAFRALTGKPVSVLPFFSVSGAYGAALLAKEEIGDRKTQFKGLDVGVATISGVKQPTITKSENNAAFNNTIEELIFKGYDGTIDNSKATVGIPRALFTFGMFPMFSTFFKELGFNVLLSDPTSEETIALGQEYSLDETCYPVKLINGHVAELVRKKVDYIFFPDLYTVDHPGSHTRQNYGCAYMQLAFKIINQAMELQTKGIELLSPTIAFNMGKEFMMKSFADLGKQLGRDTQQTNRALQKSMQAFSDFEKRMEDNSKATMETISPEEKVFVLISKIYGIADPVLNMGIPGKLMDMGYKVISFYDLPEDDISKEHPNMYWPFVQHILEPIKLIKRTSNMYAVLLTHHGCGPDSVTAHFVRELMGEKPYLNIEVDEHSSDVGIITRIEAFVHSISKMPVNALDKPEVDIAQESVKAVNIKTGLTDAKNGTTIYLPYLYPYSQIFGRILIEKGINAVVLPETDASSIDIGKKHTLTNEYFSLTALLGDALKNLESPKNHNASSAFLIPQTEGAEVYGQYNRYLRTKLDEEGYRDTGIIAPFIEDAIYLAIDDVKSIYLGLLAGDIINIAPTEHRDDYLNRIMKLIKEKRFEISPLVEISQAIINQQKTTIDKGKRIMITGEPFILYNNYLNGSIIKDIEDKGHRVVYSPFCEYMWLLWRDYVDQNGKEKTPMLQQNLNVLEEYISAVAGCFPEESPFEKDLENLVAIADKNIGFYAGWSGRYRAAKLLCDLPGIHGVITVASTYENTGIALGILHRGFQNNAPVLNLTFDGIQNKYDHTKIEAFIHYL
jgi:predicted nucleotide-binding protein (sugar kinase/HSP70/actin superfamily)